MPRELDLKAAFEGREQSREPERAEVPERIRRHAPAPVLKPGGSWRARADEVDRRVREQQEAQRARNEWAARGEAQADRSLKSKFRRSL